MDNNKKEDIPLRYIDYAKKQSKQEKQWYDSFYRSASLYMTNREYMIKALSKLYINDKSCSFLKNKEFVKYINKNKPVKSFVEYYINKFKENPPYLS